MIYPTRLPLFSSFIRTRNRAAIALEASQEALVRALAIARTDGRDAEELDTALEHVHNARRALG